MSPRTCSAIVVNGWGRVEGICQRQPRPGYALCDEHTSRLLAQAFGDSREPYLVLRPPVEARR